MASDKPSTKKRRAPKAKKAQTVISSISKMEQIKPTVGTLTTLAAKTSGGVCLSEKELRDLVNKQKITAYWAGPVSNATYSINTSNVGQVFVRYVMKGQSCDSENKDFRVIATYSVSGAYDSTKAAGSQSNGVCVTNWGLIRT